MRCLWYLNYVSFIHITGPNQQHDIYTNKSDDGREYGSILVQICELGPDVRKVNRVWGHCKISTKRCQVSAQALGIPFCCTVTNLKHDIIL